MLALTMNADEFPLLTAITHELGKTHEENENELVQLRTARRLLQEAFRSLEDAPDNLNAIPARIGRHFRRWA